MQAIAAWYARMAFFHWSAILILLLLCLSAPGCSQSAASLEISCDDTRQICYRGYRMDRGLTQDRYGTIQGIRTWREMYGGGNK